MKNVGLTGMDGRGKALTLWATAWILGAVGFGRGK